MDRLVQWTLILLFAFGINLIAHAEGQEIRTMLPLGQIFEVRTNSFSEGLVVANLRIPGLSDRSVAILCGGGSAKMIFPNELGDVIIHPKTGVNFSAVPTISPGPTLPLDASAVAAICVNPNGHYKLEYLEGPVEQLVYRGGKVDAKFRLELPRSI